jgi:hypothetical protein
MHASVLWQSTAAEKWRNSLVPSANPANMAYRCEIDLSPGSSTPPLIALAGSIVSFFTRKFYHANCRVLAQLHTHRRDPLYLSIAQQHWSSRPEQAGASPQNLGLLFPPPAIPVIPTEAGRRICFSASLLRSSRPAKWRDLASLFIAVKTLFGDKTAQNKNGPENFSEPS